jgi:hypothetical protein
VTGGQLDAEWLTGALAARSGGARVLTVRTEPLPVRDALFTGPDYVFLTWDRDDLPPSLVAKAVAEDHAAAAMGAALGVFEREAGFYDHLATRCGVRVAEAWFTWSAPDSTLLILEDLSALRPGDGREGLEVDEVAATLGALARMHAQWWGGADLEDLGFLRRGDAAPLALIDEQCRALVDVFIERCAPGWSADELAFVRSVAASASSWWRPLFTGEVTLVHGDVKPGNLFFDGMEPVFVDWQAVAVASPALDVASILGCGLEPAVRHGAQDDLLSGYVEALRAHGVTLEERSWREQLRLAAHAMVTPCIAASAVADDRLCRTLEVTARRRADLAMSLRPD